MKHITLVTGLLTALATISVYAGQSGDPGRYMQRLSTELNLTAEQQAKVKTIVTENHTKIQQLREDSRRQIRALLTTEQQTKFDAMKAHRTQLHKNASGARPPMTPMAPETAK